MHLTIRDPKQPFNIWFAVEIGRTHYGNWFAYVNIHNHNYWIRRY